MSEITADPDVPTATTNQGPDPATMPYEQAKEELRSIVASLEVGAAPLEETLELWQRGEALATRCRTILEAASRRIEAVTTVEADEVEK